MIVNRDQLTDDIFIIFQVERDEIPMAIACLEALYDYNGQPKWLREAIDDFKANHPWAKPTPEREM